MFLVDDGRTGLIDIIAVMCFMSLTVVALCPVASSCNFCTLLPFEFVLNLDRM